MAITMQQLLENLDLAIVNKEEFYELYGNAIQILVPSRNGKRYEVTLSKDEKKEIEDQIDSIISFYKNVFRKKCGPILMDLGYVKDQGQFMEYYKTSKPITFLGINSCIGVVIKKVGGVHLVLPRDHGDDKFYFLRLAWLKTYCGNKKLVIAAKSKQDIYEHASLSEHTKTSQEKEVLEWFQEKILEKEYEFKPVTDKAPITI